VLNNRGVAQLNLRHLDEAERDFNAAIDLRPDYAAAFANRGRVHIDREDYALALEDLNRAVELDDQLAQAYANRAFVHDNLGQIEEALADFARSLEISRDPQVLFSRAMLYYRFARFDEAYADFKVVADTEPESYLGYMARTQTEFLENRPTGSPPRRTPGTAEPSPDASAEPGSATATTPAVTPGGEVPRP